MLWTVPVNSSAKAVGKMVREGFTKFVRAQRKRGGMSNERLFARLDRLGFFEFTKRRAVVRNKMLEKGWATVIDAAIGRSFFADAEDLAEGGVASLLSKEMRLFWKATSVSLGKVADKVTRDAYDVQVGAKRYPILMAEDFKRERDAPGHLWGIALYRTSLLINRILRDHGRRERAYSIESGNEHGFLLITPAMHGVLESARDYERARGPYAAKNRYPNFGMPSEY